MPVSSIGFSLKPPSFSDRNPALDVQPPVPGHCHDYISIGNPHAAGAQHDDASAGVNM